VPAAQGSLGFRAVAFGQVDDLPGEEWDTGGQLCRNAEQVLGHAGHRELAMARVVDEPLRYWATDVGALPGTVERMSWVSQGAFHWPFPAADQQHLEVGQRLVDRAHHSKALPCRRLVQAVEEAIEMVDGDQRRSVGSVSGT
jgi:hypothetical protein